MSYHPLSHGDTGLSINDAAPPTARLGLDIIYVQAKRWEQVVGRPEIQKFAGALQGQNDFVSHIDTKIILIDGEQLADHMIDHCVGVATEATYELKRIDSDYFSEE